MKNDIRIQVVKMEDPTFEDGTVHVAHVTFTNPKGQAITYVATLYLADPSDLTTPIASSSPQTFTVAAEGTSSPINFSVVMPLLAVAGASFVACCAVTAQGVLVATFVGAQTVDVFFSPAVGWGDITWD